MSGTMLGVNLNPLSALTVHGLVHTRAQQTNTDCFPPAATRAIRKASLVNRLLIKQSRQVVNR